MNEMIERVAKAIGDRARSRHGGTMMAWAVSPERTDCLEFARAAIEAMREPTGAMLEAANEATFQLGIISPAAVDVAWAAIIGAALAETA